MLSLWLLSIKIQLLIQQILIGHLLCPCHFVIHLEYNENRVNLGAFRMARQAANGKS